MTIFILGINGFIARNVYLKLKYLEHRVYCLTHNEIGKLSNAKNNDIVINFCGINRGKTEEEFYNGNFVLVKNIIDIFKNSGIEPFFVHISSQMVYGFVGQTTENLPDYPRYYISSKLAGENYLCQNYPQNKFSIIRPSNIYSYDCEPYYNNILVTLIYEKITKNYKINKLNKNSVRNFLGIDGLAKEIISIAMGQKHGKYNIMSNNSTDLEALAKILYGGNIPGEILIEDGEPSIPFLNNSAIVGENIIVAEDLATMIGLTQAKMEQLIKINGMVEIKKLGRLSQPRGDMVEISSLHSKRLYMITLTENSIRGNHYHYEQIEDFYVSHGKVMFLLAHKDNPGVVLIKTLEKDSIISVKPHIIHTLVNDFVSNECEIYVASTQEYIKGKVPDTTYINIIPF